MAHKLVAGPVNPVYLVDADGNPIGSGAPLYVILEAGDIEIGAVELKDATTDTRAIVTATGDLQITLGGEAVAINQTTPGVSDHVTADVPTATPATYNVTCTVADTEYSQALPANCRYFEFQARTEATVRYAWATGKVAGPVAPYHTLKAGDCKYGPPINQGASPSTLYVASPTAGTVVEIEAWV